MVNKQETSTIIPTPAHNNDAAHKNNNANGSPQPPLTPLQNQNHKSLNQLMNSDSDEDVEILNVKIEDIDQEKPLKEAHTKATDDPTK